ncbi:alkaline phosphatase PhoX, partial [Roseibium sp. RKSG952]|uniref:alkaline phosphatase PhoX n=1 Tax=Roseibium sp. RKSG952 TaxID=2529384 RepID=UPI0012BBE51F
MKDVDLTTISADDWDELHFPRPEENDFDRVVERAISRRGFLGGVLAFGSGAAAMGAGLLNSTSAQAQTASRFAFTPIAAQTDGTVHVPEGYEWKIMTRWGDPLFSDADGYDITDGGPVEKSDRIFGENTDGMETFAFQGHELIAINH